MDGVRQDNGSVFAIASAVLNTSRGVSDGVVVFLTAVERMSWGDVDVVSIVFGRKFARTIVNLNSHLFWRGRDNGFVPETRQRSVVTHQTF